MKQDTTHAEPRGMDSDEFTATADYTPPLGSFKIGAARRWIDMVRETIERATPIFDSIDDGFVEVQYEEPMDGSIGTHFAPFVSNQMPPVRRSVKEERPRDEDDIGPPDRGDRTLSTYVASVRRYPFLSPDEERYLTAHYVA